MPNEKTKVNAKHQAQTKTKAHWSNTHAQSASKRDRGINSAPTKCESFTEKRSAIKLRLNILRIIDLHQYIIFKIQRQQRFAFETLIGDESVDIIPALIMKGV